MAKITAQRIGGTLAPYVDTDEIEAADIRVTNWLVVPDPDQPYDQWRIAGPDTGQRIRDPRRRADVFVDTYELVHGGTPDADGVPIADGDATRPTEQIWWTKKPLDLTHNDIDPEDALSGGYWYRIHVDVVTSRTENGTIAATLPAGRHHLPLEAVADWTPLYLLDAAGDIVRVNAAGQRDPAGDPVLDIDHLLPPLLDPTPVQSEIDKLVAALPAAAFDTAVGELAADSSFRQAIADRPEVTANLTESSDFVQAVRDGFAEAPERTRTVFFAVGDEQ